MIVNQFCVKFFFNYFGRFVLFSLQIRSEDWYVDDGGTDERCSRNRGRLYFGRSVNGRRWIRRSQIPHARRSIRSLSRRMAKGKCEGNLEKKKLIKIRSFDFLHPTVHHWYSFLLFLEQVAPLKSGRAGPCVVVKSPMGWNQLSRTKSAFEEYFVPLTRLFCTFFKKIIVRERLFLHGNRDFVFEIRDEKVWQYFYKIIKNVALCIIRSII